MTDPRLALAIRIGVFVPALLWGLVARANPGSTQARLVVTRGEGATACPDEEALKAAIHSRIGRDPFDPNAAAEVIAYFRRSASGFVARVSLIDASGTERGSRELRANGRCDELAEATALAIAIAVDPMALTRPHAPAPVVDPSLSAGPARSPSAAGAGDPRSESTPATAGSPAHADPGVRSHVELEAGLGAVVGSAPRPAPELEVGAAWVRGAASVGIEARVDAPFGGERPVSGGWVASWVAAGTVASCWRPSVVLLCGLGQIGAVEARSNLESSRAALWLAVGARVGADARIAARVTLRIRTDALANPSPATFRLDGHVVWKAPPASGTLGLDLVVDL